MAGNTAVGAAIGGAVGAGTGAVIGHHMDKVAAEAAKVNNAKVEEITDANGLKAVKVTFDSGILFATNKAILNSGSKNDLSKFSSVLKNNSDCHVDIYGHTDNTGNDGINIPLSNSRAQSVVDYLKSCVFISFASHPVLKFFAERNIYMTESIIQLFTFIEIT
jgi:outer membrane protein OmpA-like peptidoglycan-associated protein